MSGPGGSWENERVKTTYEEARAVIDHQRDVITDIDDKAMYTVRVVVIFIGIIVAATRIDGPSLFHPYFLWSGLVALLLSMTMGVLTYAASNLFLGPNRAYLRDLVEDDVDADRWDEDLINRLADWIEGNHRDLRKNGYLLLVSQLTLIVGVVLLAVAAAL